MSPEQAAQFLRDNNVRYLLAQFVDIHGVAKTKSVPARCLMDVVEKGAGFAGFAISGMGMQPHGSDYLARGDLSTLSLVPWQPGYARIVCTGYVDNAPHPYDSRVVLQRQVERLKARGWTLNSGLEPEFSLLRRGPDGELLTADESDTLAKPCYDYKGLSRVRGFLEQLTESLEQVGFDVYQIDHEDANGQYEINYTYSDAMTSADRFTFVRMAAGEIAHENGLLCSFMPKPFADRPGNGMHFHLSMADSQGRNVFGDDSDPQGLGLSSLAYHFLAGILHHAKALCAFAAPTINSYKRLVSGGSASGATWAPVFITYGANNRSAMVRIPYGRLELRLPDTGANPYLVHAALIAAGLDGIDRQLAAGKMQNRNLYALSAEQCQQEGIELLPQNLKEAVDALEANTLLRECLGAEITDEFIRVKRQEWFEFHRHVSDWEVNRYIEFF
ncbi:MULTISPECIES: type III glutamate--ammonia ligase [Pantoea]|uniref:Type III glutamate--ammonia ligase n=1 Tax=Candidatus Pantoea multigeneris TaxID=2608357 RepID=A0ABX0RDF0_9GAMM|nr:MULTISPECIES: type III glutamate--ammonia ligase [Pantoea]NIF22427.1 type III glutamate--ammonia ligase [Pantoea multigeneris]